MTKFYKEKDLFAFKLGLLRHPEAPGTDTGDPSQVCLQVPGAVQGNRAYGAGTAG